ncbi:hypothetical protein MHYP_G00123450 [Metynnis hypsauchen]
MKEPSPFPKPSTLKRKTSKSTATVSVEDIPIAKNDAKSTSAVVSPDTKTHVQDKSPSMVSNKQTIQEATESNENTLKEERKPKKRRGKQRSSNTGPLWSNFSPVAKIPTEKLERAPSVRMLSSILHSDYWLTSDEIDLACFYLARDNKHMDGFQSVLLYSGLQSGGIVGTPQGHFVQLLNTGGNHWVTTSNVFCEHNQICVYDSQVKKLDNTKQALSWMLRPQNTEFLVL